MELIKLQPFLLEKIWGGHQLINFGFNLNYNQKIGEAWVISAHPNGLTYLQSGKFKGKSLLEVFTDHKELFNNYNGQFPLLNKIITTNDFLPIHVHPNDNYAKKYNSLGKPESWLVLSAPKDAYLIYGHHAQTRKELETLIDNNNWDQLLKKVPINTNDYIYVDSGKIHTISPNMIVYEIQRSSDIGYRIYDYNRLENGKLRQLDIKKAIECISIPNTNDLIIRNSSKQIFANEYFSVYLWDVSKEKIPKIIGNPYWWQLTVIDGQGKINGQHFKKGESAISLGKIESLYGVGIIKVVITWIDKKELLLK